MYLKRVFLPSLSPTCPQTVLTEWVSASVSEIEPNCSPPKFDSGTPPITFGEAPFSTDCGVNLPVSSAAAAMTTLNVEAGGYCDWDARISAGERVARSSWRLCRGIWL